MPGRYKNFLIGLFVLCAIAIIVWTIGFLHPLQGGEKVVIKARFANVDKVNVGTRVTFAGRAVGEVVAIRSVPQAQRIAHNGFVYPYELLLSVNANLPIYMSDEFALRTSGLLGERSVAITPRPLPIGQIPEELSDETPIYAYEGGSVEDTFKEFKEVADHFDVALEEITQSFKTLNREGVVEKLGSIARHFDSIAASLDDPPSLKESLVDLKGILRRANVSWEQVDNILNSMSQALQELQEQDTWHALAQSVQNVQEVTESLNQGDKIKNIIGRIDSMAEKLNGSWGNVTNTIDQLHVAATNVRGVTDDVKLGKGSIGRLFVGDDLYLRTTSLLSKGEVLANDINHYGLLFHLDKGWQRLRARRANLLQHLSSPQQFRNFFNDEIDQISTSLARVSMVWDKLDGDCTLAPYFDNAEFRKVLAELLKRTQGLEESLEMYNQQVVEGAVEKTEMCR